MKQLNISVEEKAYRAAKAASEEAGMLLRKWVERAILRQSALEDTSQSPVKERTYAPVD